MSDTDNPRAVEGDNSKVGGIAGDQLRSFIERIERLEEEKKGYVEDIRDVFAEAKGQGFDTKIMRQVIRRRKMEQDARDENDAMIERYEIALGVFG